MNMNMLKRLGEWILGPPPTPPLAESHGPDDVVLVLCAADGQYEQHEIYTHTQTVPFRIERNGRTYEHMHDMTPRHYYRDVT